MTAHRSSSVFSRLAGAFVLVLPVFVASYSIATAILGVLGS